MNKKSISATCAGALLLATFAHPAFAKVSAEEASKLGKDLTCMGAEKDGNKDGSIPAYSGKWLGKPPHVTYRGPGEFWPDPYAEEKPLFVITAQNVGEHADKLTDGVKALLKKYPDTFRVPVYPSRRDFRYPDWVCDVAKKNAVEAELANGGEGITATTGAVPFPIPKSGLEALWNTNVQRAPWTEHATYDQAVVYPNGNVAWGEAEYRCLSERNNPQVRRSTDDSSSPYGGVNSWCFVLSKKPERDKGSVIVATDYFNYATRPRDAYQYNPGTRRVRQLPSFGFDMPQGPGGFRTVDDDHLFNGSPERYEWKLAGKREMYITYNNYRVVQPAEYSEMLKYPGHINPDFLRFELHRVWVLEGTLKGGFRHQYAKRVIYLDEDTWHGVASDQYDSRGQLWRAVLANWIYAYEMKGYFYSTPIHHDLVSGAYLVDRMSNARSKAPLLDQGGMTAADFTPDAAARAGK